MASRFLTNLKGIDWLLLVAIFLLICFGLSSLYSLGLSTDPHNFGLLFKQILFAVVGFGLLFLFMLLDYRWWYALSGWLYVTSIVLLLLLLFFGQTLRGTTGWFILGNFSFQPVELAKLSVILFLARCLSGWTAEKYSFKLWFKSGLVVLPLIVLAILQPDFGSALVIAVIWFGMLWLTGVNKKHLLIFLLIIILLAGLGWQFLLRNYQKTRILTFLNPAVDPLGSGYNIRQSLIAIGSGGMWGRGLGLGTQSSLHFLPVSEADFIFTALGEELGFVGLVVILFLFLLIFYRLFKIMRNIRDDFSLYLVFGLSLMFFVQLVINVGMTIGILPVTGLPLPFVSYGGSFLIISLISVGIILSVNLRQKSGL